MLFNNLVHQIGGGTGNDLITTQEKFQEVTVSL